MAIGTYEYIGDDNVKYNIRLDEDAAKAQGIAASTPVGGGFQPETIRGNSGGGPVAERHVWGEFRVPNATVGDTPVKRVKLVICDPKKDFFLNGGTFTYKTVTYRVTGAVGEKRTFFGD